MLVIPFILAAGSLPTLISGLPVPSFPSSGVTTEVSSHSFQKRSYTIVGGTGKVSDGWPSMSDWIPTFEEMFDANQETMRSSCAQWNVENNSDEEIQNMSDSIKSVASSTGVDARFILAIVMQESNGCVRAPTTYNGVVNPGLMQSHHGSGSCNNGNVQTPCPAAQITQMITDGAAGTAAGDGLKQCLEQAGGNDVTTYYRAARIYNSGSIAASQNLGQGIATHCYVSDIANRLTGWSVGPSSCDPNTIGGLSGALGGFPGGAGSSSTSTSTSTLPATSSSSTPTSTTVPTPEETIPVPEPTITTPEDTIPVPSIPVPAPTIPASEDVDTIPVSSTPVPAASTPSSPPIVPPTTAQLSSSDSTTLTSSSAPIYPYAISPCQEYYTVQPDDYCLKVEAKLSITSAQLRDWNPGLDEPCTNLWLGYQYCVKA